MEDKKTPYSDYYKEKVRLDREGSRLDREIKKLEKELAHEYKEVKDYIIEPKHIKILKIVVILLAVGIVGYLTIINFFISQDFNYFYDIGGEKDNYLSPIERISESLEDYREMTGHLVYFDVPLARGSKSLSIKSRIQDNFPESYGLSLGAKDQEVWHYTYNKIYSSQFSELKGFENKDGIYKINEMGELLNIEELKQKEEIIIATDDKFNLIPNIPEDYKTKKTIINTSLRGKHSFYIYISGDLDLEVKKQDINWYEGSDELEIIIYDLNDILVANATIEDDGIIDVNKSIAEIQQGNIAVESLDAGIYRIEFGDFDGLIREIKINTNKIVTNSLFLADSEIYNLETKESKLYIELSRNSEVKFMTYHAVGIQKINYNNEIFDFYQEDEPLYLNLKKGIYNLTFPKNDIIISGPTYFAFSKENYFQPFKQVVIPIPNDMEYIRNNVDYLVTDYKQPVKDGEWFITETDFNVKEDNLFVKDNNLNVVFNIPHLYEEQYANYTIPIDYINITIHKPGLFEKYEIKSLRDIPNFWSYE